MESSLEKLEEHASQLAAVADRFDDDMGRCFLGNDTSIYDLLLAARSKVLEHRIAAKRLIKDIDRIEGTE